VFEEAADPPEELIGFAYWLYTLSMLARRTAGSAELAAAKDDGAPGSAGGRFPKSEVGWGTPARPSLVAVGPPVGRGGGGGGALNIVFSTITCKFFFIFLLSPFQTLFFFMLTKRPAFCSFLCVCVCVSRPAARGSLCVFT
jgi:hypothetical protein